MSKKDDALKLALDYIIATNKNSQFWLVPESNLNKTAAAIREALAEQPERQPIDVDALGIPQGQPFQPAQHAQGQSCYCPECEALSKELAALKAQQQEIDELTAQRERLADILTRTANALKGQPAELSLHSWHDLPEVAQTLKAAQQHEPVVIGRVRLDAGEVHIHPLVRDADKAGLVEGQPVYTSPQPSKPLDAVDGDVLPPIGSRVFIRHGRDNATHACTVTGYFAWPAHSGDKNVHRVFVRMVYEGTDRQQARLLCDCYPTEEAALIKE